MICRFDGDSASFLCTPSGEMWNGWAVPYVSREVHAHMLTRLRYLKADSTLLREFAALEPGPDGFIKVDLGLTIYYDEPEDWIGSWKEPGRHFDDCAQDPLNYGQCCGRKCCLSIG
jgi:hypothetical protein